MKIISLFILVLILMLGFQYFRTGRCSEPFTPNVMKALSSTAYNNEKIITIDNSQTSKPYKYMSIYNLAFPRGTILLWSPLNTTATCSSTTGACSKNDKPPTGWALCDGTTYSTTAGAVTTPNMQYRFPVGLNPSDTDFDSFSRNCFRSVTTTTAVDTGIKAEGDKLDTHSLTLGQIPKHNHKYRSYTQRTGGNNIDRQLDNRSCIKADMWFENGFRTLFGPTGEKDTHLPHNNMPPYMVIKFIMKL